MATDATATPYPRLLERHLYREALPALRRAASRGDARAMSILGLYHALGIAVDKDLQLARTLMEHAARLGDLHGKTSLGVLLLTHADASTAAADCFQTGLDVLKEAERAGSIHAGLAARGAMARMLRH